MTKYRSIAKLVAVLNFIGCMFSCESVTDFPLDGQLRGRYIRNCYSINPDVHTEQIIPSQYSIDSICSLNVPDDIVEMGKEKISVVKGYIYILDTEITKKLYKFDCEGDLKAIIGERGHAKGEFIGQPEDFFIDSNNNIHVFDRLGYKIIVYNDKGSVERVAYTEKFLPTSIGLTGSDRYMMHFSAGYKEQSDEGNLSSSLLLFDKDNMNHTRLMSSAMDLYCSISDYSFFKDGDRLSYIPDFSDSVIVFRNDTLEKVVSFDFGGKSLIKEDPQALKQKDDYSFMSDYTGVMGITRYQETESLIYMEYIYQNFGLLWFYNKKNGRFYNGTSPFYGINPYSYYILSDNQIIGYVDMNTIEELRRHLENKHFQENLNKSPKHVKDLIEGKLLAPALVFMTLK